MYMGYGCDGHGLSCLGLGLNYTGSFIYLETYGYPYVYPHNYDEVMLLSSIDYHYLLNWKLM